MHPSNTMYRNRCYRQVALAKFQKFKTPPNALSATEILAAYQEQAARFNMSYVRILSSWAHLFSVFFFFLSLIPADLIYFSLILIFSLLFILFLLQPKNADTIDMWKHGCCASFASGPYTREGTLANLLFFWMD
jgi:hypothetical protein